MVNKIIKSHCKIIFCLSYSETFLVVMRRYAGSFSLSSLSLAGCGCGGFGSGSPGFQPDGGTGGIGSSGICYFLWDWEYDSRAILVSVNGVSQIHSTDSFAAAFLAIVDLWQFISRHKIIRSATPFDIKLPLVFIEHSIAAIGMN